MSFEKEKHELSDLDIKPNTTISSQSLLRDILTQNKKSYTRHVLVGLPEPKQLLIWYNIIVFTTWKNSKPVYCATITLCKTRIINTFIEQTALQNPNAEKIFCEAVHKTQINSNGQIYDQLHLNTIVNPYSEEPLINIKYLFDKLYKSLLLVLEKNYSHCVFMGLNNLIIKSSDFDTRLIFKQFIEATKEEYAFFYTQSDDMNYTSQHNDSLKINMNNWSLDQWLLEELFK